MKNAIVYVTYDGAVNSTCGVGVLSQYFIKSMPAVTRRLLHQYGQRFDFHVIAVNLLATAHGYSDDIKAITSNVVNDLAGKLHFIENGTSGTENYGSKTNWEIASKNASLVVKSLSQNYDQLYIYLIDTPFLKLPSYMDAKIQNVKYLLVPHSDVYSHFPDSIITMPERLQWENDAFAAVNTLPSVYLASTSKFLTQTISKHHHTNNNKIVNLQTGILPTDEKFKLSTEAQIREELVSKRIPLDKPLIFSVGRAVPYKGFEDLIDAFKLLLEDGIDAYLVFIASPFRNSRSNVEDLKIKIDQYNLGNYCTTIYDLDMELPRYIYQWVNTKIVAQLSHHEPFGLVPEEVRMWSRKNGPVVVASRLDGFLEQITNNKDGFLVNPSNHVETKGVFKKILSMSPKRHSQIRDRGYRRCLKNYDYAKSTLESIESLVRLS